MPAPDLLIPLWGTHGRDFDALLPIAWYCEEKLGLKVALRSMFDVHQLHRLRPRAILISSSVGSMRCVDLVKEAHACNIPTVSLTAEGDFKEEMVEQMFWGLNADHVLYEDVTLQWSERTRQMTLGRYPEYASRIRVSGAVGFDRYKIYRFMGREAFLAKYRAGKYDAIIGYAGYGFDRLQLPKLRPLYLNIYGPELLERMILDTTRVREILRDVIHAHPNLLFVLKYHPGTLDESKTELYELDHFPNVVVLRGNQEEIADIISACDVWTAYDSTTALEAWLLNKPTLVINPSGPDFVRSQLYAGSHLVQSAAELIAAIDAWREEGRIERFEEKSSVREQLVRDVIQWDDGLNHVRAANVVLELLQRPRPFKRPALPSYLRWWGIHQMVRLSYRAPRLIPLRRIRRVPELFSPSELSAMQERYYPQLRAFHDQLSPEDYQGV